MDEKKKPIIIKINDAKSKIADILNELHSDGVPYYFIEPFLSEFSKQVRDNASIELKEAYDFYAKSLTEDKNTIEKETEETESFNE